MNNNFDDDNKRGKKNQFSLRGFGGIFFVLGIVLAFMGALALFGYVMGGASLEELKAAGLFLAIGLAMCGIGRIMNSN